MAYCLKVLNSINDTSNKLQDMLTGSSGKQKQGHCSPKEHCFYRQMQNTIKKATVFALAFGGEKAITLDGQKTERLI